MDDVAPSWETFLLYFELYRDPVLCAAVAGAVLGYLGVFIVLRRMVFVTAALTQTAGLGVALGFWAGIAFDMEPSPVLSATGVSLLAAWLMSLDTDRIRMSRESLLALVWVGASAGAIVVGSRISQEAHDISGILFGTAVLVRPADLAMVLGVGAVVLVGAVLLRRGLVFAGFDRPGARVQGVPVRRLEIAFMAGLTVFVAVATRALGAVPVFAFSVLPALAALLAAPRLSLAFPVAMVAGAFCGSAGYVAAFFLELPVGASQALVATGLAVLAVPLRWVRGDA